jgi:hypothetical protein
MAKKTVQNPKRETATFSIDLKNGKLAQYHIHVPNFQEIHAAMVELTTASGKIDMVGAGLAIFNLCCYEYDDILDTVEFEKTKISICLNLAREYVSDVAYEIKKN